MELVPDFDEFIAYLTAHGFRRAERAKVAGSSLSSYALAFHGAPRFTSDLDILVSHRIHS